MKDIRHKNPIQTKDANPFIVARDSWREQLKRFALDPSHVYFQETFGMGSHPKKRIQNK